MNTVLHVCKLFIFAHIFIIIDISNTMNIFEYMSMMSINSQEIFIILQDCYLIFDISYTEKKNKLIINRSNIIWI